MASGAGTKIIRRTHLYLALFLTPWMAMYAVSTIFMNHHGLFVPKPAHYIQERELSYTNALPAAGGEREVARQILTDLGLDGAFDVQGKLAQGRLTIMRFDPVATKRIVYLATEGKITIEREEFQLKPFLRRWHTRRGFDQPYAAAQSWGLTVDLVVIAMVFWVASGFWMWWEIKPARRIGGVVAIAGMALYAVFLWVL